MVRMELSVPSLPPLGITGLDSSTLEQPYPLRHWLWGYLYPLCPLPPLLDVTGLERGTLEQPNPLRYGMGGGEGLPVYITLRDTNKRTD